MPTAPFSSQMVTDLQGQTAWQFSGEIGAVFTPRFFCCDDPNDLGISEGKQPVAVIELSPNPAFVGETVSYAGTLSYDPDGSITAYAWTFESHTPSSGTASSGTLNYAAAGTFTIQLIVTDGTSIKSLPARQELVVKNPMADITAYTASAGSGGVFYKSGTAIWEDKNAGLSGNDLTTYDVLIDPATQLLPEASKTVWRATTGGVQVSNNGGATWTEKNPASVSNAWSDGVAPTVADLTFRKLLFAGSYLFVAATWTNATSEYRSWLWYTQDYEAMRTDTSGTVTWTEVSNNWDA